MSIENAENEPISIEQPEEFCYEFLVKQANLNPAIRWRDLWDLNAPHEDVEIVGTSFKRGRYAVSFALTKELLKSRLKSRLAANQSRLKTPLYAHRHTLNYFYHEAQSRIFVLTMQQFIKLMILDVICQEIESTDEGLTQAEIDDYLGVCYNDPKIFSERNIELVLSQIAELMPQITDNKQGSKV